jgi:hypothetical protein
MTNRTKFEDLIEYVVNGEQKKAEELFHELVVEHAREIYQGLYENEINEFDLEEAMSDEDDEEEVEESYEDLDEVGGDPADDMMDKVGTDEPEMDMGDDEEDKDMDMGDDDMTGDEGEIQDLKSQLEDLIEKFKEITGEEVGDEDDMGMDDEKGPDAEMGDEEDEDMDKPMKDSYMPAFEEELDELDLSPVEQMREYVEKVADAYKGGNAAATHETGSPYTKSTVAGKNDMGGTAKNIAQGGEGPTHGTKGGLLNPATKEENAGNVNVPGSKTATKMHAQPKGHGAEKKGADEQAQNTTSLIGSKR